jgi:hypothetical protein
MSRVIAVTACGFMLTACSATMPSLNLDFMKSTPQAETLAIETEPPGAEAKTSIGQSCRTPCQLSVQPGSEFSVTLALGCWRECRAAARAQSDSRHPRGGGTAEEAGPEEKEARRGCGPPGSIAAGGLGRPWDSAGARTNTCACSCPALIPSGSGSIRDQLSLAVKIRPLPPRLWLQRPALTSMATKTRTSCLFSRGNIGKAAAKFESCERKQRVPGTRHF